MALRRYEGERIIAYCDTSSAEHPDNARFLTDCERWYGQPIIKLRSTEYRDPFDVYERTRWLIGPAGARCTTELKKRVRQAFQRPDDVHVFGFTADEPKRVARFRANNPEIEVRFPLVEMGMKHADCLALLSEVGIGLPAMYRLGYRNNNCIGCVKGGAGYWNKIRRDFPETFERMAALERRLDVAILKKDGPKGADGKRARLRVFLDELQPSTGRYEAEPEVECGVACGATLEEVAS